MKVFLWYCVCFFIIGFIMVRFSILGLFSFLQFEYLICLLVYFHFGVSSLFYINTCYVNRKYSSLTFLFFFFVSSFVNWLIFASCDCINILFSSSTLLNGVAELCTISLPPSFIHYIFPLFLFPLFLFFISLITSLFLLLSLFTDLFVLLLLSLEISGQLFVLFFHPPCSQLVLFLEVIYNILHTLLIFHFSFLVFGLGYLVLGVDFILSF